MYKSLIVAAFTVFFILPTNSQDRRGERFEEIRSHKVAYITSKLELTPEQAQKFWPIYNEFGSKLAEIYNNRRQIMNEIEENYEGEESKLEKISDRMINSFMEESSLQKEYHEKYKEALPIKKVLMLYRAEQEFKREMLRNIRDRRGPDRDNRRK